MVRHSGGGVLARLGCVLGCVAALSVCACQSPASFDILASGTKLYSQHDEELIIRHFFHDERGGTFVDVGCWDWREGSTTLYLEDHLSWSGLAVDAQPQLKDGYERHRPRTRFFNFIVSERSGDAGHLYVADQISSVHADHAERFGAQWYQDQPLEVPTITLNDLLERNNIDRIDLLSMDIEGSEPTALAGFDLRRYRPRLVVIEAAPHVQDLITRYFEDREYERIDAYLERDSVNWYFKPRAPPSRQPAR